jgi:outer membrane protein assembly factor BamB
MKRNVTLILASTLFFISSAFAAPTPGTIKWAFSVQGAINYPVAVGKDGTIYAGSQDQHF